ncbi:MAG: type II toxin-antitoxin system HicA family toxin [Thermoguttaceae bacterium]
MSVLVHNMCAAKKATSGPSKIPKITLPTKNVSAREVVSILKKHGFTEIRQKGCHLTLAKGTLSVQVSIHTGTIATETLPSIWRQAGFLTLKF